MREISFEQSDGDTVGRFQAMGGPCEVICESAPDAGARDLIEVAAAEAWRIEDKFSRYIDGNVVDAINSSNGEPVSVDEETARLIDFAVSLYDMSGRRFDITSGALRRVWTFDGTDAVPSAAEVAAVTKRVGWHRVSWQSPDIRLPAGMEIDFGGMGKEYAVDRAAQLLRERDDRSCLVNFGGDLALSAPPRRREFWSVGIEALDSDGEQTQAVIQLRAGAIATSGDARRFVLRDGMRYGHILDPSSGWPVENAPRSVTVAAETCVQAGMLSTLAMLEGEAAEAFLDAQDVRYWCYR